MLKDKNEKAISVEELVAKGDIDSFIDEIQYNCSEYYLNDVLSEVLNYYLAKKVKTIEKIDNRVSIEFTDTPSEIKASELNGHFILADTTDNGSYDLRKQIFPESMEITPTEYTAKVVIPSDFSWEEFLKIIANTYSLKIVENLKAIDHYERGIETSRAYAYVKIDKQTRFSFIREGSTDLIEFTKEVGIYQHVSTLR